MQIQFGTSSKRVNSTFIPAMSRTYNCTLKRPCTIETPVVDMSDFNINYNVAYIPDFGRYYFVTDIESISNSITRYHLSVDSLASFKQAILGSTVYVERSQNKYSNLLYDGAVTHLDDTPAILTQQFQFSHIVNRDIDPDNWGCYILQTIAPGTAASIGAGTCTYAMTSSQLAALITNIFDSSQYGTTVTDEVKTYFNPFQYIVSCQWVPVEITALIAGNLPTNIKFGWWTSTAQGILIPKLNVVCVADIVLPAAVDWTDYNADWHRMDLYIPGCGTVEIDPVYTGQTLTCQLQLDVLTGSCVADVKTADNDMVLSISGQLGVSIQLSQLSADTTNLMSTALFSPKPNGIVSGLTGGQYTSWGDVFTAAITSGASAGAASAFSAAMSAVPIVGNRVNEAVKNAMQPQTAVCGTNGNMTYLLTHLKARLTNRKYSVYETHIENTYGKPCRRNYVLSECTGFTLCNNAAITIPGATAKEKASVKNYLEGGFWIE